MGLAEDGGDELSCLCSSECRLPKSRCELHSSELQSVQPSSWTTSPAIESCFPGEIAGNHNAVKKFHDIRLFSVANLPKYHSTLNYA